MPMDIETPAPPKQALRGGIAEFTLHSFDGVTMKGRVLVGATADPFVVDARLVEWIDVEVRNLRSCDKKEALRYYLVDRHVPPARPDQRITLKPGYWYGADVNFLFFGAAMKEAKPSCFEGDLMVWAQDGRLAATLPIRVSRTDVRPVASPETGEPKGFISCERLIIMIPQ